MIDLSHYREIFIYTESDITESEIIWEITSETNYPNKTKYYIISLDSWYDNDKIISLDNEIIQRKIICLLNQTN